MQLPERIKLTQAFKFPFLQGNILCQTTFFPQTCAHRKMKTESAMMAIFDKFSSSPIPLALPCIHYFRGIYSSGGHPDWPVHRYSSQRTSSTVKPSTTTSASSIATPSTPSQTCSDGSYCKCWLTIPVCHGSDTPCSCTSSGIIG